MQNIAGERRLVHRHWPAAFSQRSSSRGDSIRSAQAAKAGVAPRRRSVSTFLKSNADGSTKQRQEIVDRFQSDSVIPVFLISLKAGGGGLNLSAADTVIHFDPWWNPAVEAQATDRAHGLGQTRVVTAYKLITRDTVEEKILRLQEKKRAAIDAAIDSEEPLMTGLTTEELEELLA
jgi:SNF2 family DNA or RNA helicase